MKAVFISTMALVFSCGCVGFDIWGISGKTAPSPSSYHLPPGDASSPSTKAPDTKEFVGRTLDLAECVRIALKWNPGARASWHGARAAAARAGAARSDFFPTVAAAGSVRRSDMVSMAGASSSPLTQFSGSLGVSFTVFDGLGRWARVDGADAEVDEFNATHLQALHGIVLRVKEAFFSLLAAKELFKTMTDGKSHSEIFLNMARARHENGLVPRSDVLRAGTHLAEADLFLTKAVHAVETWRGRLAVAMGLPVTTALRIPTTTAVQPDQARQEVNGLLQSALKRRPELLGALASNRKHKAALRQAKASWWPKISFDGSYGFKDDVFLPRQDEWSLGLGMNIPLFSGFRTGYGVSQAKARLAASEARFEELLREVEFSVWSRFREVKNALAAMGASRVLLESAAESVQVAEGEYKNGTGSMPDLTTARGARTAAEVALIRATLDWRLSLAQLEKAVGGIGK